MTEETIIPTICDTMPAEAPPSKSKPKPAKNKQNKRHRSNRACEVCIDEGDEYRTFLEIFGRDGYRIQRHFNKRVDQHYASKYILPCDKPDALPANTSLVTLIVDSSGSMYEYQMDVLNGISKFIKNLRNR